MHRTSIRAAAAGLVLILLSSIVPAASAASLPPCSKGTKVKVVKGKATMLLKGKRVACKVVKASPATPTLTQSVKPEIRFTGGSLNDLVMKPGLTVTLRNFESSKRTLVITGPGGFTLQAEPVDPYADNIAGMGAFMTPDNPGVYTMSFLEYPSAKATLTIIPKK